VTKYLVLSLNAVVFHVLSDARPLLAQQVSILSLDGGVDRGERSFQLLHVFALDNSDAGLEAIVAVGERGGGWLDAGDALPLLVDLGPGLALLLGS
jgi:hypothetical protein